MIREQTLIKMAFLTIIMSVTSVSYAQWRNLFGGVVQALGERYIDNSSYSSQDKENMKNVLNYLSNEANTNQNARNATKDAYQGNYTGAVIQGTRAILNASGNHSYDTYLNSANAINNANREYKQDLQNGMDSQEALDKRNTSIGYSTAESIIELQDRIARERLEKARQQREEERQSWESNNYYEEVSSYSDNDDRASVFHTEVFSGVLIAHVNTAAVLNAMPEKLQAENNLKNYYNELQEQLKAMYGEYQNKLQYYQDNAETMSSLVKQSKEKELVDLERRITDFQNNAESKFDAKRAELLNPILSKIQNAINAVAGENELTYVIDISTGAAVFLGEDAIDITYMVMKRLGI